MNKFVDSSLFFPHDQITALAIYPAIIGFSLFFQTVNRGLVALGHFTNLTYTQQLAEDLHSSQGWPIFDYSENTTCNQ